ncbi:MAG: hypothetical protein IPI23_21040 [Bacteroidetes bacterium]|nr:hypothetical protein [Bacteroidota bacterium]MBK7391463.1 hypothetical protein [Bacteroidota bacterium]
MYAPFETMPANSKVWIYQANRPFAEQEKSALENSLRNFVTGWTAHQADLKASFSIIDNYFIAIAVDESVNDASGCSVDKKVHFIKQLGNDLNIDFFDRMKVVVISDSGLQPVHVHKLNAEIEKGTIHSKSLFYNTLVSNLNEFKAGWKVELQNSWPVQFINSELKTS